MKFNKWTLGLAAVGAVSLASAARADETKMSAVQTALSNTTISGYVSTSANVLFTPKATTGAGSYGSYAGDGSSPAGQIPLQNGKANGFNLDVVKLSISKPQDDSEWASGYQVDLLFGPDAVGWNPSANASTDSSTSYAIQQAYIALRTPLGNGIDWKIGVWNTVVGYESFDAGSNPNYTRSWGWAVEPTEHTGILGSYKVNDELSFSAGVANTLSTGINTRNTNDGDSGSAWHKTVMGSTTFTAPSDWGWAAGSAFYAGIVYGFNSTYQSSGLGSSSSMGGNQANFYAGATLNSPWKEVTFGACFDYVQNLGGGSGNFSPNIHADDYIFGLYNTIKATDKLSFNSRAEYWEIDAKGGPSGSSLGSNGGISLTETVQYDLFANVTSRIEARYDHFTSQSAIGYILPTGVAVDRGTSFGLYANLIYKF